MNKSLVFTYSIGRNRFPLHIKEIKITPDVVVAGGELTIEAKGYLYEPVLAGATADIIVKLGVVRLLHKKFDLCDELEKNKDNVEIQCPIEEGYITVKEKLIIIVTYSHYYYYL